MTRRALLPIVLAVGALLAAAPSGAGAAAAASPSEWAKSANAICTKTQGLVARVPRPTTVQEETKAFVTILGYIRQQNDGLRKLPRPKQTASDIVTLMSLFDKQAGLIGGIITGMQSGNPSVIEASRRMGNALNPKVLALTKKLGAKDC